MNLEVTTTKKKPGNTNFQVQEKVTEINPRTYTQIHTPTVVQEGLGLMEPVLGIFDVAASISKRFCLQWKGFDLLNR